MHDRLTALQLAAAALCDQRTADRWLRGERVRGCYLDARLTQAARTIGVERASAPLPPGRVAA